MWMLVLASAAVLLGEGVNGQSCKSVAAQHCMNRILEVIQQHSQDFTGSDAQQICPHLRDNMACLLWQSANCQTREQQQRSGEHILAAKNYLDRYCDLDRGWKNSRCYDNDEIFRCANSFQQRTTGLDPCESYNRFKDCVKEVLQRRCSRFDEQLFPSFLVDRARELTWTCGSISSSLSPSYERNQPYDNSRHDSNYRYGVSQTRYDPNNLNGRYNNERNVYNDRNNNNDRYRPGYTPSQSFDDSYCLHKAQDSMRECDSNHRTRQSNARRHHADERIRESCCATIEYKSCLRQSLNNYCRDYGYNAIDGIIQQRVRDADNDCRQFDSYRCANGASATMLSIVGIVLNVLLTRVF